MKNFTVNVVPVEEGGKVPVFLAGQVMVDVQQILMDVGEYLTAKELRIQKSMSYGLISRFMLYMGADGGISVDSSVDVPETEALGNIVDDALDLVESTMDALGSGAGGYWMEDNYTDAFYRSHVIYDVVALSEHLADFPGCALMYGSTENLKRFGKVDVQKMASFLKEKGGSCGGAVIGFISSTSSKSKGARYTLTTDSGRARLSFADTEAEKVAASSSDSEPVIVGGTVITSEDGSVTEIRDVRAIAPAASIKFRRLLASNADIKLAKPVEAKITYSGGKWMLRNEDAGVTVSHESWDSTVEAFHDQMVFLWIQYASTDREFEGEEAEVSAFLKSLTQSQSI